MIHVHVEAVKNIKIVVAGLKLVELDNLKIELNNYQESIKEIHDSLDIENKKKRLNELDMIMQESNFWEDINKANQYTKESKDIKNQINSFDKLNKDYDDILTMIEIANEENDDRIVKEIKSMSEDFIKEIDEFKTKLLLCGEYDNLDSIVRLNAGSGGTESCDFCSMLFRMYNRFAQNHNYDLTIIDYLDGDEAGIKSVSFVVSGENSYGMLKSEMGVHRLVRISPFNAQGKRQTSFVSCDVMPDIKEDLDIELKDEDLKIDYYRASGAGGQHINKTSSAVRITHIPTGIVVACQEERSQFQNRDRAEQMLKAKLFILKQQQNADKLSDIRGEVRENAFGSQIRSYVLQPYRMVKDLRTGEETSNTDSVLNGNIDLFINSYLKWLKLGCPDRKVQEN